MPTFNTDTDASLPAFNTDTHASLPAFNTDTHASLPAFNTDIASARIPTPPPFYPRPCGLPRLTPRYDNIDPPPLPETDEWDKYYNDGTLVDRTCAKVRCDPPGVAPRLKRLC